MPNDKLKLILNDLIHCSHSLNDDENITQAISEIRKLMVPDFQDLKDIVWKKTFSDYMSAEIAKAIYEFMEGRV
jgi:hypothetical protein